MAEQIRRFLRQKQVSQMVGYQRSTLYAKMQAGEFPKAYPLGARAVGWLSDEIEAWINERIESARGAR